MKRPTPTIMAGEAASVCSHYDLGVVQEVHRLRRGSGQSPKVVLKTSTGLYLLKRRAAPAPLAAAPPPEAGAAPRSDPRRVALSHEAQLHLARHGVPVARLVGTRGDNNSMVQIDDRIYEVFEFIAGQPYDRSIPATHDAGRVLGLYHIAMASFTPSSGVELPVGTGYHGLADVGPRLERARASRSGSEGRTGAGAGAGGGRSAAKELGRLYELAATQADSLKLGAWPVQYIHGDWHAGNLVFRRGADGGGRVVAVVDHDSISRGQRVLDVANGVLQFSMVRPGDSGSGGAKRPADETGWPAAADQDRIGAFIRGYHDSGIGRLSRAEAAAIPWLMIEALVTEAVVALRSMGRSTLLDPAGLVRMVLAKAQWLRDHAAAVSGAALSA